MERLCITDEFGLFSWNCYITECCSWACCSLEVSLRHSHSSWPYRCEMLHSKENKLLFWALLECQSFRGWIWPGIWNSAVWRERENPQMEKQKPQDVLTLKNVKRAKKLGQKRETGGQAFIAKELFSQLRIREAGCIGWRKWDPLIHGRSHKLQWGPSWDHWPKPTEGSRVVNFGTELHTALLP